MSVNDDSVTDGWRQVCAGVALISWSRLALWEMSQLVFQTTGESTFESKKGHLAVHPTYGRLICWLSFAVGGEYLARGTCLVRKLLVSETSRKLVRPPGVDEDIAEWVSLAYAKDPSVLEEEPWSMPLGKLPVGKLFPSGDEQQFVVASTKLLASRMRNRDSHRYARNVRAFQFHTVSTLFVPAFNSLVGCLDQPQLRKSLEDRPSTCAT